MDLHNSARGEADLSMACWKLRGGFGGLLLVLQSALGQLGDRLAWPP